MGPAQQSQEQLPFGWYSIHLLLEKYLMDFPSDFLAVFVVFFFLSQVPLDFFQWIQLFQQGEQTQMIQEMDQQAVKLVEKDRKVK